MQLFKKLIATLFFIALVLPTAIQSMHAFKEHEHVVCTSKTDQHLHELENDCAELHLQLELFSFQINNNYEVIPQDYYSQNFIEQPQQDKVVYFSKKSSRAPPYFTI
ncbi:hypothetical protein WH52_02230 [Tenacibaculum holothuriorum]|uniref:Uncharacterized protein n=1 Tax=Tenacibaculum holothuriorum TaxID=1635173 RepID=A0A1Y2PG52_9FLAO|nr:hypothetical protein [Tenacibaculum holothuriorum]OSY89473.1 hypothetical protein WH52_02230 [Tenacibaculum holothuriorum]